MGPRARVSFVAAMGAAALPVVDEPLGGASASPLRVRLANRDLNSHIRLLGGQVHSPVVEHEGWVGFCTHLGNDTVKGRKTD